MCAMCVCESHLSPFSEVNVNYLLRMNGVGGQACSIVEVSWKKGHNEGSEVHYC